ncbi:hypothetical protein IW262DRAFT_1495686 [Armillaria fumosa]|nr:hypothetical protein IW262DRAFT_1495686 [Armillaria fumosa]
MQCCYGQWTCKSNITLPAPPLQTYKRIAHSARILSTNMSASETTTKFTSAETSSVAGGQLVGRSNKGAVAPKEALKLRLDLNLEVEIAIQAKVNGDITLSLLE